MFMMWITNKQARPGTLIAAVHLFIFWFLWIGRNNSKYNDVKMNATRVIKRTQYLMESLLKAGILIHDVRKRLSYPVTVTWRKPKEEWSKLNKDGALKECGLAAWGGVIRNYLGDVTWDFLTFMERALFLKLNLKLWQLDFNCVGRKILEKCG
ncbi:RNase H domain-containing protein [Abeliophyllum distichum]|uniref:RNase H domain-containing protein n=1 Tax=Abeliophyllum distichum TaxID=126358 RepID=A0ABD1QTF4_9LAMI